MDKKISKILMTVLVVALSLSSVLMGCDGGGESKAVTRDELIRPNYSKEMEAKHDAEGREHIEIPEDAETVMVEGIEYTVLRDLQYLINLAGNYILANDVQWSSFGEALNPFMGRFHGNNYKIVGGKQQTLFKYLDGATVQNIIFSAKENDRVFNRGILSFWAKKSTIKDCINYFQANIYLGDGRDAAPSLIDVAEKCEISGIFNYADFISNVPIIGTASQTNVRKCKNFGNIVDNNFSQYEGEIGAGDEVPLSGIVGLIEKGGIVEDCENYGAIVGTSGLGGIVGRVRQWDDESKKEIFAMDKPKYFWDTQIIRNCKNYGDIYLLKGKDEKRVESAKGNELLPNIHTIGGIAGNASIIENCVNEGNFYGFESLGKNLYVDYMGGIVGAAKKVTNCENKGTWNIHKGRAKNVGDLVGHIIG